MSLSTKVLFFCFSSLLLLPCQKTLVFRFFSINSQVILKNSRPLASNFSILLSNLLKKISIQEFYDTETTTARRKQKNKTLVDRKQLFLHFFPHNEKGRKIRFAKNFSSNTILEIVSTSTYYILPYYHTVEIALDKMRMFSRKKI